MTAVWRRDLNAWMLDGRVIELRQPPLNVVVQLLVSWSPVPLILATCANPVDANSIAERLLDRDDPLDFDPLEPIADAIIDLWFGMPRWTVERLWKEALGSWRDLDGELAGRGVDILALPPDRATNVVYRQLRNRHTKDTSALQRWLTALDEQPARVLETRTGLDDAASDWAKVAALAGMPSAAMPTGSSGVDSQITRT